MQITILSIFLLVNNKRKLRFCLPADNSKKMPVSFAGNKKNYARSLLLVFRLMDMNEKEENNQKPKENEE